MNSKPSQPPEPTGEHASWPVFICYRQADGRLAAELVYRALLDARLGYVPAGYASEPVVRMYFDQTAPAVSDWKAVHLPALKAAKTLVVICSPGAREPLPGQDWTHAELDWWIQNRSTPPLLIDSVGDGRWTPTKLQDRWPEAQRLVVQADEWRALPPEEQAARRERLRERLLGGIRAEAQNVVAELESQLEAERARARSLSRQRTGLYVLAAGLLLSAVVMAGLYLRGNRAQDEAQRRAALAATESVKVLYARSFELAAERRTQAAQATLLHALRLAPEVSSPGASSSEGSAIDWKAALVRRQRLLASPEFTELSGMASPVRAIDVDASGTWAAVGSGEGADWMAGNASMDTSVRIWNLETRREVYRFKKHSLSIAQVAFAPTGQRLLSVDIRGDLFVWDAFTGTVRCALSLKPDASEPNVVLYRSLRFSGGGSRIVGWELLGATQARPRTWDVERCAALEPTEDASVDADAVSLGWNVSRLWLLSDGKARPLPMAQASEYPSAAAVHSPRKLVALASGFLEGVRDDSVLIWPEGAPESARRLRGHQAQVLDLAFSPDGRLLASGSADGTLRVWDVESGRVLWVLEPRRGPIVRVAFARGGQVVLAASSDAALLHFVLPHEEDVVRWQAPPLEANSSTWGLAAASPEGRYLFQEGRDEGQRLVIAVWDTALGKIVRRLSVPGKRLSSLVVTGQGGKLVGASSEGAVLVWDLETGHEERRLSGPFVSGPGLAPGAGNTLVIANDRVELWDVATGGRRRVLEGLDSVSIAAVSEDGHRIAGWNAEHDDLVVWDADSGQVLARRKALGRRITRLRFSADSRALLAVTKASSDKGSIVLWTGAHYDVTQRIHELSNLVSPPFVREDGKLAVLCGPHDIRLLDLETARELARVDLPDTLTGCIATARGPLSVFAEMDHQRLLRWTPHDEDTRERSVGIQADASSEGFEQFEPVRKDVDIAADLRDEDPSVRINALRTLTGRASREPASVTLALGLLSDDSPRVREAAIVLAAKLPERAKESVPALTKALSDPDGVNRRRAAETLEILGPAAVACLPALLEAIEREAQGTPSDPQGSVYLWTLSALGPAAAGAVPGVVDACRAPRSTLKPEQCLFTLGELGDAGQAVEPYLLASLGSAKNGVRLAGVRAICRQPARALRLQKELEAALRAEADLGVRVALDHCLRQIQ